jgi:hypothetical protein
MDFTTLDELLQEQGPQSTPGHAEEAAVHVHVVLQRKARTNFVRKPLADNAGSGKNLFRTVPGESVFPIEQFYQEINLTGG